MARKLKPTEQDKKTQRLCALRLAREAALKEAGTWGDMMVGEILHEASRSVFVQQWKGQRRPDPLAEGAVRAAGVSPAEWMAMIAWVNARRSTGFRQRIVAWDLSADEARRIAAARIAELRAAGYTVINPAAAS